MLTEIYQAIQGQRQSWNLIKKLGDGDAGEVYLVESLLDKQPAIVKRPRKGSFFSDIIRQANQIKTEGSIMHGLQRAEFSTQGIHLTIPDLLDQNTAEFDLGEQTFIIIEQAKGLDLKLLSQVIRFGKASTQNLSVDPQFTLLIEQWSRFQEFPAQLLVRILVSVLNFLETIHATEIRTDHGIQSGVIWNDVKPDHLYWDPLNLNLTFIDWGNSQYLESNRITKDRQYSASDDFRQFIQEMGSFTAEVNPTLFAQLEWPEDSTSSDVYENAILPLKEKLTLKHKDDTEQL
ncbi:MAG TPA: serine/threonine-protein kinase, partial [Anaerolineales bacterium]